MLLKTFSPVAGSVRPSAMGFNNSVFVGPDDNLQDKYDWLKSSDRDAKMGALSATNRRTLILTPGTYTLGTTLTLDADYVDVLELIKDSVIINGVVVITSSLRYLMQSDILQQSFGLNYNSDVIYNQMAALHASTYLTTPTYDESGQAIHPDVYFNPDGWPDSSGHRWWMAMTPYPAGDASKENPSILCSDDGETWAVPDGLTNPIEAEPGTGHNADTALIEGCDNKLYCFFAWTDNTTYKIYVKSSSDGVTWSAKTELLSSDTKLYLCPTVVYDGTNYYMWVVDIGTSPNQVLRYTATNPLGPWGSETVCTMTITGRDVWHFHIKKYLNQYHCFLTGCTLDTLGTASTFYFATSEDGETWAVSAQIMGNGVSGTWDDSLIYAASGVIVDRLGQKCYRLYYSAYDGANWHTGVTDLVSYLQAGRLGVGVWPPLYPLHIADPGALKVLLAGGTSALLYLGDVAQASGYKYFGFGVDGGYFRIARQSDELSGEIAALEIDHSDNLTALMGKLVSGVDSTRRGLLTLWDGAGGNTPGCMKIHSPNGTAWYVFVEDDGTLKIHNALPTQNSDGTVVGAQT